MRAERFSALAAIALAILLPGARSDAQSGGSYRLERSSIDAGGGRSSAEGYALEGSIGQPDAGPVLTGDGYALQGGLLPRGPSPPQAADVFSDGFE
jgi:hypothetical protein